MKERVYVIAGNPVALQRPRLGNGHVYNPQAKEKLIYGIDLRNQHESDELYTEPIHMDITFFMPIPESWGKKRKENVLGTYHYLRPDIDNMVKFILDAALGVLYKDDAIVASISAHKVYSNTPATKIVIRSLQETPCNC